MFKQFRLTEEKIRETKYRSGEIIQSLIQRNNWKKHRFANMTQTVKNLVFKDQDDTNFLQKELSFAFARHTGTLR